MQRYVFFTYRCSHVLTSVLIFSNVDVYPWFNTEMLLLFWWLKNENISQADDIVVEMHSCENICLSTFRKTILFLSLRALLRYQEAIRHIKMSRTFSKTFSESFLNWNSHIKWFIVKFKVKYWISLLDRYLERKETNGKYFWRRK